MILDIRVSNDTDIRVSNVGLSGTVLYTAANPMVLLAFNCQGYLI